MRLPGPPSSERIDWITWFVVSGLLVSAALPRLLQGIASDDEARTVLAGMPCNATIEMDLALWRVAERATPYREVLLDTPPDELAAAHLAGELPDFGLSAFLNRYGSRAAGEVDVGVPRWSEDPTPVPAMPANHLRVTDPQQAPDRRFERAAAQAEAKVAELAQRARRNRRVRGRIAGFFLRRARELSGLREAGEFVGPYALRDRCRRLLLIDAQLQGNRLPDRADDVVFLTMPELRTAVERADDLREVVEGRRPDHVRELRRRSVRSPCCPTAPRWRRCRRPERRATARSPAWERHPAGFAAGPASSATRRARPSSRARS